MDAETMTPAELKVFVATCQLGPGELANDPEYADELERLANFGWLVRVHDGEKLIGYRLSNRASNANNTAALIEMAEGSVN